MEDQIQDKSKSQIKREAEELQKLGEELAKLSRAQLDRMSLPNELRKALMDYHAIKSNIAARRHRQFIGTLMRDVDPEPIRQALLQNEMDRPVEPETAKETRMWLDRLLAGDPDSMEEFILASPGLDRQRLRQLLRNIHKEKSIGKPSKSLKALEHLILQRKAIK